MRGDSDNTRPVRMSCNQTSLPRFGDTPVRISSRMTVRSSSWSCGRLRRELFFDLLGLLCVLFSGARHEAIQQDGTRTRRAHPRSPHPGEHPGCLSVSLVSLSCVSLLCDCLCLCVCVVSVCLCVSLCLSEGVGACLKVGWVLVSRVGAYFTLCGCWVSLDRPPSGPPFPWTTRKFALLFFPRSIFALFSLAGGLLVELWPRVEVHAPPKNSSGLKQSDLSATLAQIGISTPTLVETDFGQS